MRKPEYYPVALLLVKPAEAEALKLDNIACFELLHWLFAKPSRPAAIRHHYLYPEKIVFFPCRRPVDYPAPLAFIILILKRVKNNLPFLFPEVEVMMPDGSRATGLG